MSEIVTVEELAEVYRASERICVFTGAGVSSTQDSRFCSPQWRDLLYDILSELLGEHRRDETDAYFSQLEHEHKDLWHLASAIKDVARNESHFVVALRKSVLRENTTMDKKKRLKVGNLKGATTLNAVIAFCSRISHFRKYPCFAVNSKIEAVLTVNYDWFLEAGATTKHQAFRFKPMTRPTSLPRTKLPVYHIHGYLPYPKSEEPDVPLILDYDAYEKAYRNRSWTVQILAAFLSRYSTVFVGFSFEDEYLLKELRRLSLRPGAPVHYALLREGAERPPGLLDEIMRSGVCPVLYSGYDEIPGLLGRVYRADLPPEGITVHGGQKETKYSPEEIWEILLQGKQWKLCA